MYKRQELVVVSTAGIVLVVSGTVDNTVVSDVVVISTTGVMLVVSVLVDSKVTS